MGQTALLPFRSKPCWGFFRPEKSDGFGRVWTRELGYERPPKPLHYLINGTIFGKKTKLLNIKRVLWFSLQVFFWNISHSTKNSARYDHKCILVNLSICQPTHLPYTCMPSRIPTYPYILSIYVLPTHISLSVSSFQSLLLTTITTGRLSPTFSHPWAAFRQPCYSSCMVSDAPLYCFPGN